MPFLIGRHDAALGWTVKAFGWALVAFTGILIGEALQARLRGSTVVSRLKAVFTLA